jgi:hypothetical protein
MSKRRSYEIDIVVNGRKVREVVIDSHYEEKHPDVSDALILEIVNTLNGREFQSEDRDGEWEFYMLDRIPHKRKLYRLVWCMKDHCLFIGVINCFRRS